MKIDVTDISRTFGRQTRAYAEYRIFSSLAAFSNVREARQANVLRGVRICQFDADYRLRKMTVPERGDYRGEGVWHLDKVVETEFTPEGPRTARLAGREWRSAVWSR